MAEAPQPLPAFTTWDTFPFEGDLKVKALDPRADVEPPRKGEEIAECKACQSSDDSYVWVNERWRVRSMDRPTGLPMILILEPRSHLDLGDLPNLLAAELGVMTVRVERAIRSLDNVARVHVNRWGDGAAHLHIWFMARPKGQLQLRGSFLPMWDDILPPVAESQWREDLALVAAWLEEFGGTAFAQPPKIEWQAPSTFTGEATLTTAENIPTEALVADPTAAPLGDAAPDAEQTEEAAQPGAEQHPAAGAAAAGPVAGTSTHTATATPASAGTSATAGTQQAADKAVPNAGPPANTASAEHHPNTAPPASAGPSANTPPPASAEHHASAEPSANQEPHATPGHQASNGTAAGSGTPTSSPAPTAPGQTPLPPSVGPKPATAIGTAQVPVQNAPGAVQPAPIPTQPAPGNAGVPTQS